MSPFIVLVVLGLMALFTTLSLAPVFLGAQESEALVQMDER